MILLLFFTSVGLGLFGIAMSFPSGMPMRWWSVGASFLGIAGAWVAMKATGPPIPAAIALRIFPVLAWMMPAVFALLLVLQFVNSPYYRVASSVAVFVLIAHLFISRAANTRGV